MGSLARAGFLLAVVLAAGCGGSSSVGTAGEDLQGKTEARYDLTVTYWPEGKDGPSSTATLTCSPDGGTHPDPAEACAALDAHPEALHPVATDMACTQIYGGDQVALVEGSGIHSTFNRSDGCEIARWDALAPVLEITD